MPKKILVVEDNKNNLTLIRDILQYNHYEVIEAENGEVGVKKALEHLPDLILMDIQMPVMDGFEALKQLKNAEQTKHIKVIALT
ncbi:MAG: response regulator, partial [Nitrospirota bacterium]|nr:response regulator [Nitrospirota bacterium]